MTPSAQRGVFGVSYYSKRQRAAEPRKKPKRQRSTERFKREAVRPLLAVDAQDRNRCRTCSARITAALRPRADRGQQSFFVTTAYPWPEIRSAPRQGGAVRKPPARLSAKSQGRLRQKLRLQSPADCSPSFVAGCSSLQRIRFASLSLTRPGATVATACRRGRR
jgi:hypothetical protein